MEISGLLTPQQEKARDALALQPQPAPSLHRRSRDHGNPVPESRRQLTSVSGRQKSASTTVHLSSSSKNGSSSTPTPIPSSTCQLPVTPSDLTAAHGRGSSLLGYKSQTPISRPPAPRSPPFPSAVVAGSAELVSGSSEVCGSRIGEVTRHLKAKIMISLR